jgi:histidinol dehydrogenase
MGRVELLDYRGQPPSRIIPRLQRPYSIEDYIEKVVPIVSEVARRGYEAVKEYSLRLDGIAYDDPKVPPEATSEALSTVSREIVWALQLAVERAKEFHSRYVPKDTPSLRWKPLERVAAYVPAGVKPYPSTVVATVVPARIAGVPYIAILTPPKGGRFMVDPTVLVAAHVAGADEVYAVGGAQAIAGVAFGAKPLPRVDGVVGPGSLYVEAAKLLVSHLVRVDCIAGPSEIVVVAGSATDPQLVAYDMLAQVEHGPLSLAVLLTDNVELAKTVYGIVDRYIGAEHMGIAYIVVIDNLEEAAGIVNAISPEHVELLGDAEKLLDQLHNVGAIAVNVPVAYTDYTAGPSHVLPTGGAARWCGSLTAYSFLKPIPIVKGVDGEALRAAYVLAQLEGFTFHAESLKLRLKRGV